MTQYHYLDSSVALHILYGHSRTAAEWFDHATGDEDVTVFSSRLLRTEITRVLRRDGQDVGRREAVLDYLELMPLDAGVLTEAEAIVPHVKTLDAIHLASVIRSGLDCTIVTHDEVMKSVARVIGYPAFDPVMN